MMLEWTRPAQRDVERIAEYLATHRSEQTADRIALAIYDGVQPLRQFPHQGRRGRRRGTRELVFAPELPLVVVYRVRRSMVEILRVWHGAQQR